MFYRRLLPVLRPRRFQILLVTLFMLAVLHPAVQGEYIGRTTFNVLFCLFLLAAMFAIGQKKGPLPAVLLLGIPALIMTWLAEFARGLGPGARATVIVSSQAADLLFVGLLVILVLEDVLKDERVTVDKLCGAMCVYLLIGIIWALVYSITELVDPGSFADVVVDPSTIAPGEKALRTKTFDSMLYYSYVTLSTLGYGDVTPVSQAARTFSWLEAVVGQLYLAVLIARLVGLHIAHRNRKA